ncbi:MAG: leucine-rich repeat domain-containing protein [Verrucomicrobia bacterium]|nr:leucine-rich repeat domain-containing protein [Verrucomicrobiota bacterium]
MKTNALLLGFFLIPALVQVRAAELGHFRYEFSGTEITITGYTGPGGEVTIPAAIAGLPVTRIAQQAFQNAALTSVVIPDSVTSIGDWAFGNCTGLTSVVIPDSVISIESWAFSRCAGLTHVVIPDSVTRIGERAFSGCTGLTNVVIGNGVGEIGDLAFANCTGLTRVVIPDRVGSIGCGAFSGCSGLSSIEVGSVNAAYSSEAGVLFDKGRRLLIRFPQGLRQGERIT